MIRKIVILIVLTSLVKSGITQENSDITGVWSTESFPTTKYLFESNGKVTFHWLNDLGSISRNGKYSIIDDTIKISYERFFHINSLFSDDSDTLSIYICNDSYQKMPLYKCLVKYGNNQKLFTADSTGHMRVPNYSNIDSIYLDHVNSKIYPLKNNYVDNNFNNELYALSKKDLSNNNVNFVVNGWSVTRKLKIKDKELLILNENQIFDGTDYDPTILFFNKMLIKEE
ncbi:MAG: hypothetical protein ACI9N1_002434 [Flavobacteriales bacterium]|jgi:hypothetical protein